MERFNAAFGRRDIDAVMAAMSEDCVFENTAPPNGHRYAGHAAVGAPWEELLASAPEIAFDTEEMRATENRAVLRWLYRWRDADEVPGQVRGIDLFQVRDGKVAEKLSYVKG